MFLVCKSNRVYNSKLKPLYTASLHSIKHSGCKFDKNSLAVEQNNYLTKIVYIGYELYDWPNILLKNLTLKNCLSGV